jgi:hypothetical protein
MPPFVLYFPHLAMENKEFFERTFSPQKNLLRVTKFRKWKTGLKEDLATRKRDPAYAGWKFPIYTQLPGLACLSGMGVISLFARICCYELGFFDIFQSQ